MDEENGNFVDDDSGNEMHGVAKGPVASRGKFTRARYFNNGGIIEVPNNPTMQLWKNSFSVSGWIKTKDHAYPLTSFAMIQGYGCYFSAGKNGVTPGWDIGHGFSNRGTNICLRDNLNNIARGTVIHNNNLTQDKLLGKWTHYTVVFNRDVKKIFLYINGVRQESSLDISNITGDIKNDEPLSFGGLYGWKTKGFIDEYRMYNKALLDMEVMLIYKDHEA